MIGKNRWARLLATMLVVTVVGLTLTSCESTQQTKRTSTATSATENQSAEPARVEKFYFVFSSSGFSDRPSDAFRVDTNHSMDFETRSKGADGAWHSLKGMAILEPSDYDTFAKLISDGKLLDIDPTDLMASCASGEAYTLTFGSTLRPKPTHVDYTACTIDYNLLVKPQRANFVALAHWFDAMRAKYRPAQEQ